VTSPSKRRRVSLEQEEDDLEEDVLPDNGGPNVETDTTVISRQTVVASNALPTKTLVRRFVKQEWGKEIMQQPLYTVILKLVCRCQDIADAKHYVTCPKNASKVNKAIDALKILLPPEEWKALLPSLDRPRPGAIGFKVWYMSKRAEQWRLEAEKLVTSAVTTLHLALVAEATKYNKLVAVHNGLPGIDKAKHCSHEHKNKESPITIPVSAFALCLQDMKTGYGKMGKPLPNLYKD
jgi:hypothetical protein